MAVDRQALSTFARKSEDEIRAALAEAEALVYDPTASDEDVEDALDALEKLSPEWAAATRLSAGEWRNPKHQP